MIDYSISFNMIMHAGAAKSLALEAVELATDGQIAEAQSKLKEAEAEYNEAHKSHKGLLDQIMCEGKQIEMDLMLTHALDHLTASELVMTLAQTVITLCRKGEEQK